MSGRSGTRTRACAAAILCSAVLVLAGCSDATESSTPSPPASLCDQSAQAAAIEQVAVEDLSAGFRSLTDEAGGAGELSVDDQAASLDLPVADLERLGFAQAHEAVWGRDEDQTELIVRVLRFEGDEGPRSVDDAVSQPDAIVVADPVEGLPGSEVLTPDEGEPPFVYVTVSCGSYFVYVYELGPAASATEVQDVLLGQVEALSSPGP